MTEPVSEDDQDADSLVPVVAMILTNYLGYRSATNAGELSREHVQAGTAVAAIATPALTAMILRILARHRQGHGRAGDELIPHTRQAVAAGVAAGVRAIEDAVLGLENNPDELTDKPTLVSRLSRLAARSAGGAAVLAASGGAGWGTKIWNTQEDSRVRPSHRAMQGQQRSIGEPFTTGAGVSIGYPHDPAAPLDERIGCRCFLTTARR